jgi:polyisoprenoid-binding protein YceI
MKVWLIPLAAASFLLSSLSLSAAESYKLDPVHTFIHFKVQHLGAGLTVGRFDKVGGTLTLDGEKSAITITAESTSVNTANEKRDEHLRGADFFNAKEFPQITFTSTAVKKTGDKTYEITGDFAMLGTKKSVTFTATQTGEGKGFKGEKLVGFTATFPIKRSEFGMKYMLDKLGEEVTLMIDIEAISQ